MSRIKKKIAGLLLLAVALLMFLMPVQAKTVSAKKYSLKNVANAETAEGEWVAYKTSYRFRKTDGTYVKDRWINADGHIFYVDSKGLRVKGWVKYRKNLYYVRNKTGVVFGWLNKGGKLYYFNSDGAMAKGLTTIDGAEYYFGSDSGQAKTGWKTIGKAQYYFDTKTYQMKTSTWIRIKKKYYYVNAKGKKKKSCWLTLDGRKYYLDSDGARVTGTCFINGKGYYFNKNGVYDSSVKVKDEVDTSRPMVALTFDDGPGPYTSRLLDCLEKYGAKATFFMVGSNVSNYKSVVKRMATLGCELGNHSYSHSYMTSLSDSARRSEVSKTNSAIKSAAGRLPTLFRLPYGAGASDSSVLASLGLPSIYWSIDTRDWANTGNPQHTVNAVLNSVKNGDIILMHDIHKSTVIAAETIIPSLIKKGYQLVTVSQLAKYKGKTTLKSGRTYYNFH